MSTASCGRLPRRSVNPPFQASISEPSIGTRRSRAAPVVATTRSAPIAGARAVLVSDALTLGRVSRATGAAGWLPASACNCAWTGTTGLGGPYENNTHITIAPQQNATNTAESGTVCRARLLGIGSPELDDRAGLDERRHPRGVPVGQAHASVRLRRADAARFGRAVEPVVFLAQVNPHDADRIIGTRFDDRLRVVRLRVPEQLRVVVKRRIPLHAVDRPVAD